MYYGLFYPQYSPSASNADGRVNGNDNRANSNRNCFPFDEARADTGGGAWQVAVAVPTAVHLQHQQ